MVNEVQGFRVFNPHVGTRDGLEFTASHNHVDLPCFISGTALGILRGNIKGSLEDVFNERWNLIALAVSRKSVSTPAGQEIVVNSADVMAPG
ncbi:hypothetical protein J8I87_06210 [Paraburkholderia sp. LEh10]|uniref:hypothetical protein n=1 Tax=Paraburkholderia sp. LEh10 TaxID=2821353 RepID=UPI001AE87B06|nr:hypothetical protein [Paraburkholderia sp. LEh10]MBP0589318.1 hypothetical protein [Paraburkholderia sp. LEh10]